MAIVAISATLAVPDFSKVIEKKRLALAAETVAADFNFFAAEGLKRRTPNFSFNFDDSVNWCYGIEEGSCDCTTASDCSIRQVTSSQFHLAPSVTSTSSDFAYNWVRGTVTPGSVTFSSPGGFDLRLNINALGRTSICSPSDNMIVYPSCPL